MSLFASLFTAELPISRNLIDFLFFYSAFVFVLRRGGRLEGQSPASSTDSILAAFVASLVAVSYGLHELGVVVVKNHALKALVSFLELLFVSFALHDSGCLDLYFGRPQRVVLLLKAGVRGTSVL